jgi:pimeloyl-ACP methyl ester carboxylesterase
MSRDYFQKNFINLGRKRIGHYLYGEGDPIIMVHGFPSSSFMWNPLMGHLINDGFKCGGLDLMGLGDTLNPMDMDFGIEGQAVHVFQYHRHFFKSQKTILIGHELGAAVALTLALQKPGMVKGLILTGGAFLNNWPTSLMAPLKTASRIPFAYNALIKSGFGLKLLRHNLEKSFYSKTETNNLYIDDFLRPISNSTSAQARLQKLLTDLNPRFTNTFAKYLYRISIPVLVLWGENDSILPVKDGHKLSAAIKGATFKAISNCGHFAPIEQPEQVAELITNFIKQI